MAAYGVPRSTLDLDLLTTESRVLVDAFWSPLRTLGPRVDIRRGEHDDPLAGVVRLSAPDQRAVDLIVGRHSWQRDIVARATPLELGGARLLVAEAADLVLLKLYAGGPQDRWDIHQMLSKPDGEDIRIAVDRRMHDLPQDCAELWRSLRAQGHAKPG